MRLVTQSYSDLILADSPAGYWRFEETSGTTAADETGNGEDLTILEAALNGSAVIAEGGLAASFNGGGTSHATLVSGTPIIADGATSFSIEVWVEIASAVTGTQYIISYPEASAGSNGADIRATAANVFFDVVTASGGLKIVTHSGGIPTDTPTHLVVTYDGANVRGYYNGVLETPVAQTTGLNAAATEINIGRFGSFGAHFIGRCDEAAMYTSVLSDAQVLAHYNAGI
jgi:hypothetical protein